MRRLAGVLWLAVVVPALLPVPARAATFTITRTDDPAPDGCSASDCSLREAIVTANTAAGPDTIVVPPGRYVLSIPPDGTPDDGLDGDLDIREDLVLEGGGAPKTVLDANHIDRVVDVCCEIEVGIIGVTITSGATSHAQGGGGLIAYSSRVTLREVAVVANATTNGNGGGVAIINPTSVLFLRDSVLTGNSASESGGANGGGLSNGNQATAVLTSVTVSGNTASQLGGGIDASGPIIMANVTITGNAVAPDAGYGGASRGGGIAFGGSTTDLSNTIVAGNTAATEDPDCHTFAPVTSEGYNLVQANTSPNCTIAPGPGDLMGIDPLLGPLADNGGPTMTHALLKGSPAVDAGGPGCTLLDQRGLEREACDIGAYELVLCGTVPVNRFGDAKKNALAGTPGPDGFLGFGGNDRLRGKGGPDALCGGPGRDLLKGGGGKDRLYGGPGRDTCVGQAGRDKAKSCELRKSIP